MRLVWDLKLALGLSKQEMLGSVGRVSDLCFTMAGNPLWLIDGLGNRPYYVGADSGNLEYIHCLICQKTGRAHIGSRQHKKSIGYWWQNCIVSQFFKRQ